jgi:hypothetical protein
MGTSSAQPAAGGPVKLPKDWRRQIKDTSTAQPAVGAPVKLPKNWKAKMLVELELDLGLELLHPEDATKVPSLRLPKDWKTKLSERSGGKASSPTPPHGPERLPKDWKTQLSGRSRATTSSPTPPHAPVRLPKGWKKQALATMAMAPDRSAALVPVRLPKDWKAKALAANGRAPSPSTALAPVRLPKDWKAEALAANARAAARRSVKDASRLASKRLPDRLALPPGWEAMEPAALTAWLAASPAVLALPEELKRRTTAELAARRLVADRRLAKDWAAGLEAAPGRRRSGGRELGPEDRARLEEPARHGWRREVVWGQVAALNYLYDQKVTLLLAGRPHPGR